jgi:hypothetical protein
MKGFLEVHSMSKEISSSAPVEMIETTIGDLIEAITDIALESGNSEAEGYQLASMTIESILRKNRKPAPLLN